MRIIHTLARTIQQFAVYTKSINTMEMYSQIKPVFKTLEFQYDDVRTETISSDTKIVGED